MIAKHLQSNSYTQSSLSFLPNICCQAQSNVKTLYLTFSGTSRLFPVNTNVLDRPEGIDTFWLKI